MQRVQKYSRTTLTIGCQLILATLFCTVAQAQAQVQQGGLTGRKPLAPFVLKVLPTELNPRDTFTNPLPVQKLSAQQFDPQFTSRKDTLFGQTQRVVTFRHIWQYEFAFTGLRQAQFVSPHPDGRSYRKNVWYMVYRIRNLGKSFTFDQVKKTFDIDKLEHTVFEMKTDAAKEGDEVPIEFLPRFSLEGSLGTIQGGKKDYKKVVYRDQISPVILAKIRQQEDPNLRLLDTLEMSKTKIPIIKAPNEDGVWGVAIWEDVDPRLDYVSVYISGLTNAYRVDSRNGKITGFRKRTLQLNFWRPGDSINEDDDLIDYGIPLISNPAEQVEICDKYELPGPLIRGYIVSSVANRNVQIVEVDGEVSLQDFRSSVIASLESGQLSQSLLQAFADAGVDVPNDVNVRTLIQQTKWSFKIGDQEYILQNEPEHWEPKGKGIRFLKSLDHLWIYR